MSEKSPQKEPESKSEDTSNADVEMNVSASMVNKSEAMDVSEKSDGHNTSDTSPSKKSTKKRKIKSSPSSQSHKKMKKDPNKPEYPKVGYVRYMNVRREELRKESPDMHHLEVTKKIGEEWMTLSDEKKQPYLDAAVEDKIRYKMEMKAYNKKLKLAEQEKTSTPKGKKKSSKDLNTSESTIDESPKKKKIKLSVPQSESDSGRKSPQKPNSSTTAQSGSKKKNAPEPLINTPPPTPPQIDSNGVPIFGDIPIFTDKFLEHNRQMETELKKIRKMNTDYEQQNAVLEKHVENVKAGITKTNTQIDELRQENDKLAFYLEKLRLKLATQLRNLSIPTEPNGANIENIDKYMNDLYDMAKDNSHGPASLNKAKDLLRKVDLNIDLKSFNK